MRKVTQWFSSGDTPVYAGAYELRGGKFAWWNGRDWSIPHFTPMGAMGCAGFYTPIQNRDWRGLADKPKGKS